KNPVPVIKTWPREALMIGPAGRTGGADACSPGASVGMRDTDRLLVVLVAVRVLREWRRSSIPSTLFQLITTPWRRQVPGPVGGPNQACRAGWRADPTPKEHRGLIVVGRSGLSRDEGAGLAPRSAARDARIRGLSGAAMCNVT